MENTVNLANSYIGLHIDENRPNEAEYKLLTRCTQYQTNNINTLLKANYNTDKSYDCYSPVDKPNRIYINDLEIDVFSSRLCDTKSFIAFIDENYDILKPLVSQLSPVISVEVATGLMNNINDTLRQAKAQKYVDELNRRLEEYNSTPDMN